MPTFILFLALLFQAVVIWIILISYRKLDKIYSRMYENMDTNLRLYMNELFMMSVRLNDIDSKMKEIERLINKNEKDV